MTTDEMAEVAAPVATEPMRTLVEMLIDAAVRRAHLCDDPARHFEQNAVVRNIVARIHAAHAAAARASTVSPVTGRPIPQADADALYATLGELAAQLHTERARAETLRTSPCGSGLDDAAMLQEVAFHLRLSARELPEGHHRELIEGHRRQLLDLSGRILAAATPPVTEPTP